VIILIAGIHAVGKSFLTEPLARQLGVRHATASQLIREQRGIANWGQDKKLADADANQTALIAAVKRIRASGQALLLDGHFVLRNAAGGFFAIDKSAYMDLGIDAVLLLEAESNAILNRLRERGDHSWSKRELEEFSAAEATRAHDVASSLSVPFQSVRSPSNEAFKDAVVSLLNATKGNDR